MKRWTSVLASVVVVGAGAGGASAQDVATLQRNIQFAEQTLQGEPYLTQYCGQLKTGDFFFHRGRHQAGKQPVVSLAAYEALIRRETAAGRLAQDRADNLLQVAKRRRNEVQNACNLDYWKAELAKLQKPKVAGSAPAAFVWNREPDGNRVLNGNGTLTGDHRKWSFTGQVTPSWNNALRIQVTCEGELLPGEKPGELFQKGKMRCRAEWQEAGKRQAWNCEGPGISEWGTQGYWFGIPQGNCVGTVTADNKTSNQRFGLMHLKSVLGKK